MCTVLAIAAAEDMEVHTMDVSSAFLNGDLDEETYMAQPVRERRRTCTRGTQA